MVTSGDEVRDPKSGKLGVILAVSSASGDAPAGPRASYELCVRWDGSRDEEWLGEADIQITGYKRERRVR